MQANEFVKKFGLCGVKSLVFGAPSDATSFEFYHEKYIFGLYGRSERMSKNQVSLIDLKRLVESWELVEACGGVDKVKEQLKAGNVFRFEEKPLMQQAIADVESCQ